LSDSQKLRVGVIGLGFMGKTHVRAYAKAAEAGLPCELVAVCDDDRDRRRGKVAASGNIGDTSGDEQLFDPDTVAAYARAESLLEDEDVDVVSICTPTPTHVSLACAALLSGKHVLVEKPVALTSVEVSQLLTVAEATDRVCMPAMCMRFWPGWSWVLEQIQSEALGAPLSATFHRLGSQPAWSEEFYGNPIQSGGAMVDLHVHDSDFVMACFGTPAAVVSTGTRNHITSLYRYRKGPDHVVAEGGWGHSKGFDFRMRFVIVFEQATVDFDLARDPMLQISRDGTQEAVPLDPGDGYDGEIRHFLECLANGKPPSVNLTDALAVTRMLEAERKSLETESEIRL